MFRVSCAELYEAAKRLPKRPARSGSPLGLGLRSAVCGTALEKSGCETRNFDSPGSGTHAHTDATRQKHWTLTRDTRRDRLTHYPIRDWRYCIPPRSCMCPWPCLACQLSAHPDPHPAAAGWPPRTERNERLRRDEWQDGGAGGCSDRHTQSNTTQKRPTRARMDRHTSRHHRSSRERQRRDPVCLGETWMPSRAWMAAILSSISLCFLSGSTVSASPVEVSFVSKREGTW